MTNKMTKTLKYAIAILALAASANAQIALSTTTLGAAALSTDKTITLASTSTMQGQGTNNAVNTCIYVDKEVMGVATVVDSTHVTVVGRGTSACGAVGAAARPMAHASGAKVYFSVAQAGYTAATLIGKNYQPTAEDVGACTASALVSLPRIYLYSGDIANCLSSGQWFLQSTGTMNTAGQNISAYCTGQLGSGTTNYLGNIACSSATAGTSGVEQVVSSPGVLANMYAYASTGLTGTSAGVLTLIKNGTGTALTCTFVSTVNSGTTCQDLTHSVAVVPGDKLTWSLTTASSDTGTAILTRVGLY